MLCDKCINPATHACIICDLNLCTQCWSFMHSHGTLTQHKKWQPIPIESKKKDYYCEKEDHTNCIMSYVNIYPNKQNLYCNKCRNDGNNLKSLDDVSKALVNRFSTNNMNLLDLNTHIQNKIDEKQKIIDAYNEEININNRIINNNLKNISIINDNNYLNLINLVSKYCLKNDIARDPTKPLKPIFIEQENKKTSLVELTHKTTIAELHKMCKFKFVSIPVINGTSLRSINTLSECNIFPGDTIKFISTNRCIYRLYYVTFATGKIIEIELNPNSTVEEIKTELLKKYNREICTCHEIIIYFNSKKMLNNETLHEIGAGGGSALLIKCFCNS